MDVGFDTIGNATLICYDRGPVLATDPWIVGSAYFGSWGLSHEVPVEQAEAVKNSEYVWISHGHPDHLNADSEPFYLDKKILLPDHVGGRILKGFQAAGLDVTVLKDRTWHQLSERIRVACLANHNQDGILLIDLNGRLLVNMNDATWQHGWLAFIRGVVKRFDKSFLLRLTGYGSADMINLRDEDGRLVLPDHLLNKPTLRGVVQNQLVFGTTGFIPFSSMHRYQRKDSIWAQEHVVLPEEYGALSSDRMTERRARSAAEMFPAFIRYCCDSDTFEELRPRPMEPVVYEPEHFGDNWADELDKDDAEDAARYFKAVEHLRDAYDFVNLRVGGRDNVIDLGRGRNAGLTFEAPRHSLMAAIRGRVFDDMLIGNYMRTTQHGSVPAPPLMSNFTRHVAKYADNGGAHTRRELSQYMAEYRRRAPVEYLLGQLAEFALSCKNLHRPGSIVHRTAKAWFHLGLRGRGRSGSGRRR